MKLALKCFFLRVENKNVKLYLLNSKSQSSKAIPKYQRLIQCRSVTAKVTIRPQVCETLSFLCKQISGFFGKCKHNQNTTYRDKENIVMLVLTMTFNEFNSQSLTILFEDLTSTKRESYLISNFNTYFIVFFPMESYGIYQFQWPFIN